MKTEITEHKYLIQPGFIIIYKEPAMIYGVVGSGIFLGIWDEKKEYSGCCSYLYPKSPATDKGSAKYANVAIRYLIKKMRENGSNLNDLKALFLGGASLTLDKTGEENAHIAKEILNKYKIEIVSNDIGGKMGRKFVYDTRSSQIITLKTKHLRKIDWYPYQ